MQSKEAIESRMKWMERDSTEMHTWLSDWSGECAFGAYDGSSSEDDADEDSEDEVVLLAMATLRPRMERRAAISYTGVEADQIRADVARIKCSRIRV